MLLLISVSPPIQQARLTLALASLDKLWKFTASFNMYSWFARDVTKNQTKKLSILLSSYFHEVLQYLNIFT